MLSPGLFPGFPGIYKLPVLGTLRESVRDTHQLTTNPVSLRKLSLGSRKTCVIIRKINIACLEKHLRQSYRFLEV